MMRAQSAWLAAADAAALSHGLASLAFFVLALLLISNWRARQNARALLVACLATGIWATGTVVLALLGLRISLAGDALEMLRTVAWLVFLLLLIDPSRTRLRAVLAGIAVVVLAQWLLVVANQLGLPAAPGRASASVCRLLLAVLGMLLVEQWYRNTPPLKRWGIKFACLGVGGLFAYDFYLYSDALLFRTINDDIWAARGIVDALCAPLLAISAARNPAWALGLSVSRQMLYRSAALLGSAIYLLAMAASAYYLRYFGGTWGALMQMAYLGGAALLLAGVLFSGSLRAKLKVYINKNFYNAIFDYREEWLRFTRALSEDGPALGERTIQALAQLVESRAGALWILREGQFAPAASWNWPPPAWSAPASGPLCQFLEARLWVIDVPDCEQHPRQYGGLALPPALLALPDVWLLVPLMLHGQLFAFVALARPRTPIGLNWEIRDVLKIAGSQAASYLAHRESLDSLMVSRQFESFNRMSTFIVHDLKNLVFQLSLLLSNAEKHRANPAFQEDMLGTLDHSVQKMKTLLQKLALGEALDTPAPLRLDGLLRQAVAAKASLAPAPRLEIVDAELTVLAHRARLERVLGHLIQNAIEATASDGSVAVRLLRERQSAVVELDDTGQGMSEQFIRERLFKPFDSTKTAGMGIGVFESREYIREVGGSLEVRSAPQVGTTFRVILPLHVPVEAGPSAGLRLNEANSAP
ncbi:MULTISPECIES: XrtA/PEP-CTERM system histidine kinase PrsK [unclassified Janthinobacterium]|uniref:XrtA/PEP-CTERM system histidine kinase PrsK n=1 Tax=unclassified Janthinobacterium TaxID=2610881 RepID=UPI0008906F97|nr:MULTISPECIES: XrtA/PEP-CTERM system histidine kinase PrsK [unclassified Janthinobacterium]SDA56365.1 putative PEP-CTERM system histidine kinase [Janthinobacterium sp. 551a]SFB48332.1 putative PEP-CTERM system histidine kinase [Janthinobacterium sp. 344]